MRVKLGNTRGGVNRARVLVCSCVLIDIARACDHFAPIPAWCRHTSIVFFSSFTDVVDEMKKHATSGEEIQKPIAPSSTTKTRRRRREHGCQQPFHSRQVQVVSLLLCSAAIQYAIVLPPIPEQLYNTVLIVHLSFVLLVIASWLKVSLISRSWSWSWSFFFLIVFAIIAGKPYKSWLQWFGAWSNGGKFGCVFQVDFCLLTTFPSCRVIRRAHVFARNAKSIWVTLRHPHYRSDSMSSGFPSFFLLEDGMKHCKLCVKWWIFYFLQTFFYFLWMPLVVFVQCQWLRSSLPVSEHVCDPHVSLSTFFLLCA